jgi:hypothetical protein
LIRVDAADGERNRQRNDKPVIHVGIMHLPGVKYVTPLRVLYCV